MKKALKISAYILGSILLLVLLVVGFLTTPTGENFVRKKAVAFLSNKLKTEVRIGKLNYSLPTSIELGDVLLKDQQNDTLLSVGNLTVNVAMLKLLSNKLEVNRIELHHGVVNLYRTAPDTVFNFDYIAKAFSSPPDPEKKEEPTDTSGRMELDVRKLILSHLDVRFNDYTGGSRFMVKLDTIFAGIEKVDPYHMDFGLKELYVNNLQSSFIIDTSYLPETIDTTASGPLPGLAAKELNLNNVSFTFQSNTDKFFFSTSLKKLFTHPHTIDLNRQFIAIQDLHLDTTVVKIVMGKTAQVKEVEELVDTATSTKWKVVANTFKVNGLNFFMDDENSPRQKRGIDYAHLGVSDLVIDAEKIWYTTDTIAANLNNLTVKEQSGLNLKKLQTNFVYYPKGARLDKLYLETDKTLLKDYVELTYPSVAAITTKPDSVQVKLNLNGCFVGMSDILLFAPQLAMQEVFKKYKNDKLKLTAAITGKMSALDIAKMQMQGLSNTYVDISGKLNGLPDADKISYNLSVRRLQSGKALLTSLLPPTVLQQVNPPDRFNITGRVSGTTTLYNTNLVAATTDGNAAIRGVLNITSKGGETYDMHLRTDKLNIGKILRKDTLLQTISATVTAKGRSFDINTMNAMLRGEIQSAGFQGYNYTAINFEGNIADKNAVVNLVSKDPNAVLSLDGKADFNNKYPAIVAKLIVDSADLQALKLYAEPLRVHLIADADFKELNPDYPNGQLLINKPVIQLEKERYVIDSIFIVSKPSADTGNHIIVNADAIFAVLTGKTPLSQIGNIVQSHINRHYSIDTSAAVANIDTIGDYNLNVNAVVVDRPLLHILLPGLQSMDSIKLDASLTPRILALDASMPRVVYNNMNLYNGKVNVSGTDSALTYAATLDRFQMNSMQFWYASVTGGVRRQEITARVNIKDSAKDDRFSLGAIYKQDGDTQRISLQDRLKLNYKDWQVSTPNAVVLGKDGLYVQNFRISNGGESISINSESPQFSAPMVVAINDFLLSNITEIVSKDTLLANGVLSSNMRVTNLMTQPEASGTLTVRNLAIFNDTIGNIDAELKSATANKIDTRIAINGKGNDVTLTGFYYPQPVNGNNFDLDLRINAINLQSMEGLAQNQISNSSGYVKGELKITGSMTAPKINGELRTDNLQTTVAALGTPYKMPAEKIRFTENGISFDNFKIVDEKGRNGTIDGDIIMKDFSDMKLKLRVRTRKFQALNSEKKNDQLFYGKLLVSSNLRINGTPAAPQLDGNITVHDSTDFTVVLPKNETGIEEHEGIVEFVDMSDTSRNKILVMKDTVATQYAFNKGTDINVNLSIEKQAEFNVIIDEATGDFLNVKGEASLNTEMNPDGSLGITGKYELNQGFYELNYNLIKRRFEIQPGSTITFAGDPLTAAVDITAVYTANIPPYDLVEKQVSDPAQLVYYKQRLPFQVKLKLSGEIMKPAIAFDIVLPEEKGLSVSTDVSSLVQAKLGQIRNNASELNKQVFAVLILNRFVSENPLESGTSTSAEFIARQSVSRFISEQLNNFAKDIIGGIDLTLDLETSEDYTTGQKRNRTDLNVAASKRLLNDRLTLTVGNNFGLEGPAQANQNTSLIPGNLAADYQLSRDGRYMVRLYRKNDNTDIIEGYVVETGASFIVTLEYNRFRNIFINRKKQLRNMREQPTKGTSN